ncbi:MAG TPA: zeta toxin family protein [Polyangia bacterium]
MPCIYVLAGTNGAGKSSVGGAMFRQIGADYFNPDEAARSVMIANPALTQTQANAIGWHQGKRLLERAIRERLDFAFETTLGGKTMVGLLEKALQDGLEVRIWYAGLSSPELHVARVKARVVKGGHPIPDADVYRRYEASRLNLVRLLPALTELRVFDNSRQADPGTGASPAPTLLLHMKQGRIINLGDLHRIPQWAKPIVAVALKSVRPRKG